MSSHRARMRTSRLVGRRRSICISGEGPADLHQLCLASPVAHGPKLPQKADAKAPGLLGGTVALPVPPQPPAKAAQARALAKNWGPTPTKAHPSSERGAARRSSLPA